MSGRWLAFFGVLWAVGTSFSSLPISTLLSVFTVIPAIHSWIAPSSWGDARPRDGVFSIEIDRGALFGVVLRMEMSNNIDWFCGNIQSVMMLLSNRPLVFSDVAVAWKSAK